MFSEDHFVHFFVCLKKNSFLCSGFKRLAFLPPKPIAEYTKDAYAVSATFFYHANSVLSYFKVVLDLTRKLQPTIKAT